MDSRKKTFMETLFIVVLLIVVFLSLTLAPTWLMAFLILFGVIALVYHKLNNKEEGLPTRDPASALDARGRAVDAVGDASALAPGAVGPGGNMRRQPGNEEVERVTSPIHDPLLRAPSNPVGTSEASCLRLQFVTKLPKTIFTKSQIKAVDDTPLKIELVDGRTNETVTSGCLSSINIEIFVLDGDFGSDKGDDWTEEEFNCNITRGRCGKPLITGELAVALQGGIGYFHNLSTTDNLKWTRSKKFRLGARAAQGVSVETRIREARSEAFTIRIFRGKKHYPPSLSDEVWRLVWIARDGAPRKRLAMIGVNTVQDFLQLYEADASILEKILGRRIPALIWKEMVEHASTCEVNDNKMYTFYHDKSNASITFNSVMKVTRAMLNGETYESVDRLTDSQKKLVRKLKRVAFRNKDQWVALDALPSITPLRAPADLPA